MATVTDIIEETRRLLFSGGREERNKLSAAVTNVATAIPLVYELSSIKRGTKLSIDLEDIYVWGTSSLTATPVDRGQFGSTAASHVIDAIAHVNPKFSNWEIFNAINDEINALSSPVSGLYRVSTTELTYNAAVSGYNFSLTSAQDILEVRYAVPGPSLEYPRSSNWEFSRDMSDEFASGGVLFVRDAFPGKTVLVKAKVGFVELAATMAADLATTFLPTTCYDILSLGAAWRLTAPREVKRNFDEAQGDTRRADEVPPGGNLGGSRELGRLREQRIREESARLAQRYPIHRDRFPYQASYT